MEFWYHGIIESWMKTMEDPTSLRTIEAWNIKPWMMENHETMEDPTNHRTMIPWNYGTTIKSWNHKTMVMEP